MAFLEADIGERFFIYERERPGDILLAVKVLDIYKDSRKIKVKIFNEGSIYERIFGDNQEESAGLPKKCNIGGAFNNRGMLLLIAADVSYAIVRQNLYVRHSLPIGGASIRGFSFEMNPLELRYSEVYPNNGNIIRQNIRDLRKGPLEYLAENRICV